MSGSKRGWFGSAALVGAGMLGYAIGIEPFAIRVEHVTLRCERLPSEFDGYRVLLLSDFHMRALDLRERRVLKIVSSLPEHDLIALDGDFVYGPRGMDAMATLVSRLRSRDGIFGVFGNSEHKNGVAPHIFAQKLTDAGATMLLNRNTRICRGDQEIVVAGVDDPVTGYDDIGAALDGVDDSAFKLLLMHTPDSVALAVARGVDVVLSGHTHGGQVKLPLIGAVFTHSHLGSAMSHGIYRKKRLAGVLGFRPGRTQLYVTRGIGISGLALRFLCRPEITSITLRCILHP
jgi:predicted MPP superfamily phosphohydrolase